MMEMARPSHRFVAESKVHFSSISVLYDGWWQYFCIQHAARRMMLHIPRLYS